MITELLGIDLGGGGLLEGIAVEAVLASREALEAVW